MDEGSGARCGTAPRGGSDGSPPPRLMALRSTSRGRPARWREVVRRGEPEESASDPVASGSSTDARLERARAAKVRAAGSGEADAARGCARKSAIVEREAGLEDEAAVPDRGRQVPPAVLEDARHARPAGPRRVGRAVASLTRRMIPRRSAPPRVALDRVAPRWSSRRGAWGKPARGSNRRRSNPKDPRIRRLASSSSRETGWAWFRKQTAKAKAPPLHPPPPNWRPRQVAADAVLAKALAHPDDGSIWAEAIVTAPRPTRTALSGTR